MLLISCKEAPQHIFSPKRFSKKLHFLLYGVNLFENGEIDVLHVNISLHFANVKVCYPSSFLVTMYSLNLCTLKV